MRPVPALVTNIAIVIERVDSVDVVHITVVVVIDVVAGNLTGVRPDICREVGMVVVDTGIDCGHDDAGITRGLVPR